MPVRGNGPSLPYRCSYQLAAASSATTTIIMSTNGINAFFIVTNLLKQSKPRNRKTQIDLAVILSKAAVSVGFSCSLTGPLKEPPGTAAATLRHFDNS